MSWFQKLFGRKPAEPIQPEVTQNADGSVSTSYSFTLDGGSMRPVADEVVEALDDALGRYGDVVHAVDPTRMLDFDAGGPPVWSVGTVVVDHEGQKYRLFLTYGFSSVLSPSDFRADYSHEYSIAVPVDDEADVPAWPAALLRHMTRYVLTTRADLRVGDNIPLPGPITRVAFSPEHHASMPDSVLDNLLVGPDPLLGSIDTPRGSVEVRRLVGLRAEELRFVQQWNGEAFFRCMQAVRPDMTCELDRGSLLEEPDFSGPASAGRDADGSSLGVLYCEGGWTTTPEGGHRVHLPGGADAAQIRAVLEARLPFGRSLLLRGPPELGPVEFRPAEAFGIGLDGQRLVFEGQLDDPQLQAVLAAVDPSGTGGTINIG